MTKTKCKCINDNNEYNNNDNNREIRILKRQIRKQELEIYDNRKVIHKMATSLKNVYDYSKDIFDYSTTIHNQFNDLNRDYQKLCDKLEKMENEKMENEKMENEEENDLPIARSEVTVFEYQ